jgi:hypothetical protein
MFPLIRVQLGSTSFKLPFVTFPFKRHRSPHQPHSTLPKPLLPHEDLPSESTCQPHTPSTFFNHAQSFLRLGDLQQSSEKLWGAATQGVKGVGRHLGYELRQHHLLQLFVEELCEQGLVQKDKQMEFIAGWGMANWYVKHEPCMLDIKELLIKHLGFYFVGAIRTFMSTSCLLGPSIYAGLVYERFWRC